MKDKKIIFGITLAFIFLASVGFSYAYFSNAITNKDVKDQVVETGTLQLTYTDGPEINIQNMKPGNTITKTITVKNTGSLEAKYNIIWQKLINEITNDEMLIEGTCTSSSGNCDSIESSPISNISIKKNISIASGVTHTYNLTITFKDTNASQNYNQGKKFSGVLGVEEYKAPDFETDSWSTIIANVKSGHGSEYAVGSTKEVNLGSTYGTHTLRVANTTTPSECLTSGFSQSACGFVLEFADIITEYLLNPGDDEDYSYGDYREGWSGSAMRRFVNKDIYNLLPIEIQEAIIDTKVDSSSVDKLYLLKLTEVYGKNNLSNFESNLTRQLDYYIFNKVKLETNYTKAIKSLNGVSKMWWLITPYSSSTDTVFSVNTDGTNYGNYAANSSGVSPAFRIG